MVISVRGLMTVILIQTLFPTSKIIALENASATMRLIQERCVKCHGKDGKVKGKVDLLKIDSFDKLSSHPDLIKEIIDALDTGDMPPENEPLLPETDRSLMITALKDVLISTKSEVGKAEVRRLNRFQTPMPSGICSSSIGTYSACLKD